jgi:atypical dual specificity phosphatase
MPVNFGWVWPGRLAGMGRPRPHDVEILAEAGIRGVLTLTEEGPLPEFGAAGLVVRHEPIRDFAAPDVETLTRCVEFVETMLRDGTPVVVHCFAGYGRTGTVLAAVLAASGVPPENAVREIRAMRPGSIETPEQEAAVIAFAASRRTRRPRGKTPR